MRLTRLVAACFFLLACTNKRERSMEAMNKGVELARANHYDQAALELARATQIDPTHALAWYNLGKARSYQKRWNEAAGPLSEAVKLEPGNLPYRYDLGAVWQELRRFPDARREFETCIAADGTLYKVRYRLGTVLEEEKMLKEAEAQYREAIRIKSDFAPPYVRLGNLLLDADRDDDALHVFTSAPRNADAHYGAGLVLEKKKQPDAAIKEFQKALEIDPRSDMAVYAIGKVYAALFDKDKSRQWLRKYLDAAGGKYAELTRRAKDQIAVFDADDLIISGQASLRQKDLAKAEADFRRALDVSPEHPGSQFGLGRVAYEQKRYDEAVARFGEAAKLSPDDALFHKWLGQALVLAGRGREAVAELERALQLKPGDATAKSWLQAAKRR